MVQIYFLVVPLWAILVCKIPQFWAKATDSEKLDTLMLLKIHIMFWGAKKGFQLVDKYQCAEVSISTI